MPRANHEVVRLLRELSTLTEIEEGDPQAFRVRAYDNAARAVEGLSRDVADMSEEELREVRGIGSSIAARIREYVEEGRVAKLEELRSRHPPGQLELMRVPGIGPRTVQLLSEELGVEDVDALARALDEGRVAELPGMGEKTAANLRRALDRLDLAGPERRIPIAQALPLAERVVAELQEVGAAGTVAYAGSLRRFRSTIGDVDVLVATDRPEEVMAVVADGAEVSEVLARGSTKTSVLTGSGPQVDVRAVPPRHLGAALVYFTGSKAHNIRLRERALARDLTLNEYALARPDGEVVASTTEEEVYAALDLPWIPPELREDDGEIELAEEGRLPRLLEVEDLRGDLHDHSDWSGDGRASLEQMVEAVIERGLDYLAITDHAENLTINGVSRQQMLEQRARVRELREAHPGLLLLHGAELNIGPDGSLDYDHEFLLDFDWCVASVHSHFNRPADEQTDRVVAALRHPAVTAIGHLTGRRIGKRPGIDLDVDRILEVAAETGTAIEINGNLDRLDAPVAVIREGAARGVTFVVSSDAHAPAELANQDHAVRHARRAGLTPDRVANTRSPQEFLRWVAEIREP